MNNQGTPYSLRVLVDTGGEDVHHPYSAFNQGFSAQANGYDKSLNPYPDGTTNDWWDDGWDEAKGQA